MDLYLLTIIYQVLADLENDSIHYIFYARYFFYDEQMYDYEPVYINKNSIRDVILLQNGLGCRMMMDADNFQGQFSIFIPFDAIRKIVKVRSLTNAFEKIMFSQNGVQNADSIAAYREKNPDLSAE